jgi:hypothetical protein
MTGITLVMVYIAPELTGTLVTVVDRAFVVVLVSVPELVVTSVSESESPSMTGCKAGVGRTDVTENLTGGGAEEEIQVCINIRKRKRGQVPDNWGS